MTLLALTFAVLPSLALAAADAPGCSDHPLVPSRIPGYVLASCEANDFSTHEFGIEGKDPVVVEGKKTVLRYELPEGAKGVSYTFIGRNYTNALAKVGGKVLATNAWTIQVKKETSEAWVAVSGYIGEGSPEVMGAYLVTIVEKAAMAQVVTAAELLGTLKATGRVALYIQFDTGKAAIRPESEGLVKEMGKLLADNKGLKAYVVGHTDNQGGLEANLKLSADRADAVVTALTTRHGIGPGRLIAKGVGPLAPVATNANEDGRRQNRRVELVQQ